MAHSPKPKHDLGVFLANHRHVIALTSSSFKHPLPHWNLKTQLNRRRHPSLHIYIFNSISRSLSLSAPLPATTCPAWLNTIHLLSCPRRHLRSIGRHDHCPSRPRATELSVPVVKARRAPSVQRTLQTNLKPPTEKATLIEETAPSSRSCPIPLIHRRGARTSGLPDCTLQHHHRCGGRQATEVSTRMKIRRKVQATIGGGHRQPLLQICLLLRRGTPGCDILRPRCQHRMRTTRATPRTPTQQSTRSASSKCYPLLISHQHLRRREGAIAIATCS